MANQFESVISAKAVGTQDVANQADAIRKLSESIDGLALKANKVNEHPGFGEFAEKVKQGIENPLQAIGGAAEDLLNKLGPVGVGLVGFAGAFAVFTKVSMEAARELGELGDGIEDTGVRMGLTTREVQEFRFAMKYAGGDMGTLEGITRKLSQEIDGGGESLQRIGVSFRDVRTGELRPMSDIVLQLAERLKAIPDTAHRNAEAIAIMGKGAMAVLPDLLELPEGIQAAQRAALVYSEQELASFKRMHEEMAIIDQRWDFLKTKMKEGITIPLAWVWSFNGTTGKKLPNAAQLEQNSAEALWGGPAMPAGAPAAPAWALEIPGQAARIAANDASIAAARGTTDEERLASARRRLEEDLKSLKAGVLPEVNAATLEKIRNDRAEIAGIEAKIKATHDLEAAMKALSAWEQQMSQREMTPVEKIFAERDVHAAATGEFGRATDAALPAAVEALGKMREERWKTAMGIAAKSAEYFGKSQDGEVRDMEAFRAEWVKGFLAYVQPKQEQTRAIGDIDLATDKAVLSMGAARADRLQQMMMGPGHEAEAAVNSYRIRLDLAQRIHDLDVARAMQELDKGRQAIDLARIEADLKKETYEAEIERELKLAEIQRQRIDQWRSFVVGALHGLESGDLGGFFKQQASGLLDRVAGNAAEMGWKQVGGMIPHAAEGSFMGKLLAGSQFGPDPMKVAGVRLETAGDRLTMAAADLTGAARVLASSPSGGGGGFVRLASGAVAGAPGYLPIGAGEAPPTDYLGGGDWGDGTILAPHTGGMNWGKTAGMVGAGVGGFYGLYSGIQAGGARGALTAAGSTIAAAGSIVALASKSLASIAGPIGLIAGLGLGTFLPMLFGDPRKQRAEEIGSELQSAQYHDPGSSTYTVDRYGRNFDSDMGGGLRPIIQINIPVQAMDAKSFGDQVPMVMDKIAEAFESRAYPRVETHIRRIADRG